VVDRTPASYEWTIQDVEAPTTTLSKVTYLGPNDLPEPNSLKFEFTGEDNRTLQIDLGFECRLDDGLWDTCDQSPHYLALEGLTAGPHVFEIRAVDDLGNVDESPASHNFTTQAVPARTTIESGPPAQTESTEATFTFSSDLAGAAFECSLDKNPVAFTACPADGKFTNVPYGNHELLVRAVGPGGPDPNPDEYSWESGHLTAPVTTISSGPTNTSGPEATTANTSATFVFDSTDQDATFQCKLDTAANFTPCTSPQVYENLTPGETHTFEVQATKPNLLASPVPVEWEWTILDNEVPTTTLTDQPAQNSNSSSATFSFTGTDNAPAADLQFQCRLDSMDPAAFGSCSSPENYSSLGEGPHTFEVRAVDQAGNVDPTPESYTWTVDTTAPVTTLDSTPDATSTETTATFRFSSEAGATFECKLDDAASFTECSSPQTYTDLSEGSHTFEVRATDALGNVEEPVSYTWTVDTIAPKTTIGSGPNPNAPTASTTATFEFTSEPLGASFECSLNGAPFVECTSPHEVRDLAVRAHELRVRAKDEAGNVDQTPASYTWTVKALPETTIESKPESTTVSTEATFTFSSSAPNATFECSLDNATPSWGSCPVSSPTYKDLAVGEHELLVRAEDADGDVDPTPASYRWTIKPLPETRIMSGPEDELTSDPDVQTDSTEANFTFESTNQPNATFECRLDLGAYEPCTSPKTYTGLAFDEHDFLVRAKDADGNFGPPEAFSWEIADITPPETTIDSKPEATTSDTSARFTFSSNETDATFECSLDNDTFRACSSPRTWTGLTVGEHTLSVQAIDPTQNIDPTPATYTWTIVPPNTATGTDVAVEIEAPDGTPATVLFAQVTRAGDTTMTVANESPALPNGYLQAGARFYDVDTTAAFTGPTEVCLGYDPADFTEGPRLLHYENGAWTDVTTGNPSSGLVCGTVQSLSP
ncbi:MAG: hypothetical protein ACRDTR_06230, partial [Rubrobacter sp.]